MAIFGLIPKLKADSYRATILTIIILNNLIGISKLSNKNIKSNYVVYCHTSPSGKKYIGQTNNYEKRCREHQYKSNGCVAFAKAINRYGWDNFNHEILATGLTSQASNHFEEFYIKHFNSFGKSGYNLLSGGNAPTFSEESKQRMSESSKGENHPMFGKNHTPETIEKISSAQRGENHHNFGGTLSPEHRAKISASNMGKKFTPSHRSKLSAANIGKILTPEHRDKISASLSGENSPNFGKFGKDHPGSKTYKITRPDGLIEIITGLKSYCRDNGLNQANMSNVASGRYKHHRGYRCEHCIETEEKEAA